MPLTDITIDFLQQYFDKILVVSIPRFAERHEKLKEHLKGLSFEFFWGTDKLQLNKDELIREGSYNEELAKKHQRQGKSLNLGEIACSLSHRNLYTFMIAQEWEKVLVLEDDILPLYRNLGCLANTLQELPPDWELVYLGYLKHEKVTARLKSKLIFYKVLSRLGMMKWNYTMVSNILPKGYSRHLRIAGFHDCTHAYAITSVAAKKLLAHQTPVSYRADDLLSTLILKGELNAFITDPKFFDQEIFHDRSLTSDIRTQPEL